MKFSKEEISLCRQIAEKHRRLIKYGDWMILEDDPNEFPALHFGQAFPLKTKLLPLWTISDCLEFLGEKDFRLLFTFDGNLWVIGGHNTNYVLNKEQIIGFKRGKTPLEACLRAVLAVLEEEK